MRLGVCPNCSPPTYANPPSTGFSISAATGGVTWVRPADLGRGWGLDRAPKVKTLRRS